MGYVSSGKYSVIHRDQFKYLRISHPTWVIYVVSSGQFVCTLNGKNETVTAGDTFWIPPDTVVERCVLERLRVHYINVVLTKRDFPLPAGKVTFENADRLHHTLQLMKATDKMPVSMRNEYLNHCINDILLLYYYEKCVLLNGKSKVADETVLQTIEYLKQNYRNKIQIGELAAQFGISPSGLVKKFRHTTGVPPQRHLINIRIQKAKRLLVDTSMTITEISERTGFENGYYFSKAFRKETGLTPSEYRKTYVL